MAQSVAFAVQNVELLAAGLASDSAARSEARRRLQSRREHAYARDAAETLALAMEAAEEYEPSAVLLQDDGERDANIETDLHSRDAQTRKKLLSKLWSRSSASRWARTAFGLWTSRKVASRPCRSGS